MTRENRPRGGDGDDQGEPTPHRPGRTDPAAATAMTSENRPRRQTSWRLLYNWSPKGWDAKKWPEVESAWWFRDSRKSCEGGRRGALRSESPAPLKDQVFPSMPGLTPTIRSGSSGIRRLPRRSTRSARTVSIPRPRSASSCPSSKRRSTTCARWLAPSRRRRTRATSSCCGQRVARKRRAAP